MKTSSIKIVWNNRHLFSDHTYYVCMYYKNHVSTKKDQITKPILFSLKTVITTYNNTSLYVLKHVWISTQNYVGEIMFFRL